jgi:signal peptidase I
MEKTLLPGDLIFVNKMSYGIRLPITPLTIPLTHQKTPFNETKKSFTDIIELPYLRLFSSEIKRKDVVVFNYPMEDELPVDHRSFYIKRCIALPGDTLVLKNKVVYINDSIQVDENLTAFNYNVQTKSEFNQDSLMSYGITEGGRNKALNEWNLTLTTATRDRLDSSSDILSIRPIKLSKKVFADYIFPYHRHYIWNVDYFGPLIIPKKGTTVNLDNNSIYFYQRIISVYENNEFKQIGNTFIINGDTTDSYTFKMDYYFMMGDNRHNSSDSRFWGFVPENHIVGKATSIIFSINKDVNAPSKYRDNRFFKDIN